MSQSKQNKSKLLAAGYSFLKMDKESLTISIQNHKHPNWRLYESGFKDVDAMSKKFKSVLSQHQNYLED